MKFFIVLYILFTSSFLFSQGEETGPLITNPHIHTSSKQPINQINKSLQNSFDSTIIYIPDTLSLPIFDEFSKNKFQKYNAAISDPGVTSSEFFHLVNASSLIPLPASQKFSSNPTHRRVYAFDNITYTDNDLTTTPIKVGSLATYPINYITQNVYPPYNIIDSTGVLNDIPDTVPISNPDIVQDSATQFFTDINDPNAIWLDSYAYHNYRFAVNPWSIGVATFDGLDEYGKAYARGSTSTNYADYLTSKPIDMSPYSASDSVYLSFLYQPGGYGDQPENSDSLVLDFYSIDLQQWIRVWSDSGFVSNDFKVGHICIKNAQYFKKGFQFRFKNYGNLSGGFDHFNLDYVHLRTLSGQQDTLFKDYAWVYPITTLLKDYTSVPWDHYKNNFNGKMSDSVNLVIRNGSNISENNSTPGQVIIDYSSTLEAAFPIPGNTLSASLNYAPRTTYSTFHDLSGGYQFDPTKSGTKETFDIIGTASAQFPNFNQNDSTFSSQYFANYYSYDDGTAEVAYGTTGAQSRLAVKFVPYESDSIIGIMTNFVESGVSVVDKLFLLTIWDDNNGKPGIELYKDDIFFPRVPKYGDSNNEFYTYYLNDSAKVKVNGPFYIGWQQFSTDRLNIGFDKNISSEENNFFSLDGGFVWNQSQIAGSVLIRPVFSTAMDAELGITENRISHNKFNIYPNPTNDIITIETITGEYKGVEIYNLQGILILESQESTIDLSNYPSGIYLLKTKNSTNPTYKVIKY